MKSSKIDVFEEVDTRGGYHDEMKTRLIINEEKPGFHFIINEKGKKVPC